MKASDKAYDIVKQFEGCRLGAYQCPAGIWTIGYGSTADVEPGMRITQAEADDRLKDDMEMAELCVNANVTVPLSQPQFDALCSWVFNLGCKRLKESTMLKKVNAGLWLDASVELRKWDRAGGQVLAGLTRRRMAESRLFETEVA